MSIRFKLFFTYAISVIISGAVLFLTGMAIIAGFFWMMTNAVFNEADISVVTNKAINIIAEVKYTEEYHNERLIDPVFHEEINEQLDFFNGGLVVQYGDEFINYTEKSFDGELYERLAMTTMEKNIVIDSEKGAVFDHREREATQIIAFKDRSYFYLDFRFEYDHEPITYYLIADITSAKGQATGRNFLFVVLIVLMLITTPLMILISRSIINPLKKLEKGANNIKDGNLDFSLKTNKRDEIGRVMIAFERMRKELKSSIEKQIKYEENRKELISSISHDLKTPMTSIKGYVEGIRDGIANTPEKMERYLGVIYHKSEDMEKLIDDLFMFSKLDLNKVPFEMTKVPFIPFMEEIVDEFKLEWENDTNRIQLRIDENVDCDIVLELDPQKMKRVFVNIIQNSIRYMDKENKEINMYINNNQDYIQVIISDNGMGIHEEDLKYIFDKFYRVDASRNTKAGGTGLGLAISKQIIESHFGQIKVVSEYHEGTKMIIELKKMV